MITRNLLSWLGAILATEDALTPSPGEVERRLGAESPGDALDLATLRDLWALFIRQRGHHEATSVVPAADDCTRRWFRG